MKNSENSSEKELEMKSSSHLFDTISVDVDNPKLASSSSMVQRLKSQRWFRLDASGKEDVFEADKFTMMDRCDLLARDLRALDPLSENRCSILVRENAILLCLEHIRWIITADEVFVSDFLDDNVIPSIEELRRIFYQPAVYHEMSFEFKVLGVALDCITSFFSARVIELETAIYPALDMLTNNISSRNLDRLRKLKRYQLGLGPRVQKVRDEIKMLLDDDELMAEMCLTEKKRRWESSKHGVPAAPVSSPSDGSRSKSRSKESKRVSGDERDLEILLEAWFFKADSTLNKLTTLKEYTDETEDYINIQLDTIRNQLIRFDLLLSTTSFVVAIFGLVAGVFGTNLRIPMYNDPGALKWVMIVTGVSGALMFAAFLRYFKKRRLLPQ